MKKRIILATVALSTLVALGMAGCNKKEETEKKTTSDITIQQLYEKGYSFNTGTRNEDDGVWKAYFTKDNDWQHPYLVEIPLSNDEYDEMSEKIAAGEEEKAVCSQKDISITDKSDEVPDEDQFKEYVGKPLSKLVDDEYFVFGNQEDEDGNLVIECSKPGEYSLAVIVNEKISFDDFNNDLVDYNQLTVKEVKFAGFAEM